MRSILKFLCASGLAIAALPAAAALNVFACEPEWSALAQELGGDKVSAYSATTALQDPHRIEARPSLIARIRSADLLICSGSELEIGWLPLLLTQSGNGKIQLGTPGYLEASQYVTKLEIPKVLDRALGDIHPGGNPHIHTDPRNIAKVAAALEERLAQLDPANAGTYHSRAKAFADRWQAAIARWEKEAAPLKGVPVVVHHKAFSYFINWTGMREVASLEPKPGIPPTPSHLAELLDQMKSQPAKVIVYSSYNSPQAAQFLSERSKIPTVMLPFTVGGTEKAKDLFGFFDDMIERLLGAVK
jgi:zinc/manganese transport system substrate-binding protein